MFRRLQERAHRCHNRRLRDDDVSQAHGVRPEQGFEPHESGHALPPFPGMIVTWTPTTRGSSPDDTACSHSDEVLFLTMATSPIAAPTEAIETPVDAGPATEVDAARRSTAGFLPELTALAVVIISGSTFTLTESVYEEIRPARVFGFMRFMAITLIASAVLAFPGSSPSPAGLVAHPARGPAALRPDRALRLHLLPALVHAQPGARVAVLQLHSMRCLAAAVRGLLRYHHHVIGERQGLSVWLRGDFVALAGVAMFLFNGEGDSPQLLGNVISFLGGASFAMSQVFNRRLIRAYPASDLSAYSTLFSANPAALPRLHPQALGQGWGAVKAWCVAGACCYMYAIFPGLPGLYRLGLGSRQSAASPSPA